MNLPWIEIVLIAALVAGVFLIPEFYLWRIDRQLKEDDEAHRREMEKIQ